MPQLLGEVKEIGILSLEAKLKSCFENIYFFFLLFLANGL
jgi:hypothetical protein